MGWNADAERVRDGGLAFPVRVVALHHCIGYHAGRYGFQETRCRLRDAVGAPDDTPPLAEGEAMQIIISGGSLGDHLRKIWPDRPAKEDLWTEQQILEALRLLEESRASWLHYERAFAEKRRREKAKGRRQARKVDLENFRRRIWLKHLDLVPPERP